MNDTNLDAKNSAAVEAMQNDGWVWDGTAWCGAVSSGSNRRNLGEPVAWRRRHPNGKGGFHDWILDKAPTSNQLPGSEYESLHSGGPA